MCDARTLVYVVHGQYALVPREAAKYFGAIYMVWKWNGLASCYRRHSQPCQGSSSVQQNGKSIQKQIGFKWVLL